MPFIHWFTWQEAHLKEAGAAFQREIANLTRLVEAGAGLSALDDNMHDDMRRQNEELVKDRDEQVHSFLSSTATPHDTNLGSTLQLPGRRRYHSWAFSRPHVRKQIPAATVFCLAIAGMPGYL